MKNPARYSSAVTKILFLIAVLLNVHTTAHAQSSLKDDEHPAVVKAIAPVYPAIAVQARAEGKAAVEVKIDADGTVSDAHACSGPPLLLAVSRVAALRWRFSAVASGSKERIVQLTFVFRIVKDNKDVETAFYPEYTVELAVKPPELVQTHSNAKQ